MGIVETKKRVAIKKVRSFLKSRNIACHMMKQPGMIKMFARLNFNEDIELLSGKECVEWLINKYEGGTLKKIPTIKKAENGKKWDKLIRKAKGDCYKAFLNSDYWRDISNAVKKRDNNACVCGSLKGLQVHHKTYENHFSEHNHLEDLITLCSACHKKEHGIK